MAEPISENARLYSIGHSDLPIAVFVERLRDWHIESLVDVRAWPGSRRHPQFNRAALQAELENAGIAYRWMGAALGGRRPAAADSVHRALPQGLRGYADHMRSQGFRDAAADLLELSATTRVCVMCAERDPGACHRLLLSDYITRCGMPVMHIIEPARAVPHVPGPALRVHEGKLIYDRGVVADLFGDSSPDER